MTDDSPTVDSIIREVPLDNLADPKRDVRDHRDPDQLRNLAQSMEQHGQRVPLDCWLDPDFLPEDVAFVETAETAELFDNAEQVRITDGLSRKAAAEMLEWPTVRCEISRSPPPDETIAQIAANTDRIDMGEYETIRALREHQERTGVTQGKLADLAGMSEPYLSQLLGALDEPEPIVDAWRNPETHIETGHVLEIAKLPDLESKQVTFNSIMSHNQGVSATRTKVQNRMKEAAGEEPTPETVQDDRKQGINDSEKRRERDDRTLENEPDTCLFCGALADVSMYIDLCEPDYQSLSQAREHGETIMPDDQQPGQPEDRPTDDGRMEQR